MRSDRVYNRKIGIARLTPGDACFFNRAFAFVFVVLIFYIYQSICVTSRYCRWPDFAVVSKKGRELEFPYIGNYSSQRGVEGNLKVLWS